MRRPDLTDPGSPQPFVGRQGELQALTRVLQAARAAQPQVALVEGPAGIGKSTLISRFLADATDLRSLWVTGEMSERMLEFGAADQLLRRGGYPGAIEANDHLSVGLEVLRLIGEQAPIVLIIDDVQWVDGPSLRAILFALRRLVSEPTLTILAARTADDPLPDGLRRIADLSLRLTPLDAQSLRALAEALGVRLSARAAERLAEYTGGNPLYARELLDQGPATWEYETAGPVPRTYDELVAERLSALSTEDRRLVFAASVLGDRAPLVHTATIADVKEPLEAVLKTTDAGLLTWDGRDLVFPHPLARVAVYHRLTPALRSAMHVQAASLVEDPAAALQHKVDGATGPDARLAETAEAFAQHEARRGAWSRGVAAMRSASSLSQHLDDRERRMLEAIYMLLLGGDGVAAREMLSKAGDFVPSPRLDVVRGYTAIYDGDPERACSLLRRAWDTVDPAVEPDLAGRIAALHAFVATNQFDSVQILRWSERAIEIAPERALMLSTLLAVGHSLRGHREEAHGFLDAAIATVESSTGRSGFPARSVKGALLLGDDKFDQARTQLVEAEAEARSVGSVVIAAQSLALLAKLQFANGEWDQASATAARGVTLATEADELWVKEFTLWAALQVPLARGEAVAWDKNPARPISGFARIAEVQIIATAELAAANRQPAEVVLLLKQLADGPVGFWRWQPLLADALIDLGRLEEAEAVVDAHLNRWGSSVSARLTRGSGRIFAARDQVSDAERAFHSALAAFRRLEMPYEAALTELEYGRLLRRDRRRSEGASHLMGARCTLLALRAAPALELCRRELAACGIAAESSDSDDDYAGLTPQERSVAQLVASGYSNARVASELLVSVRTVEAHLTRVYRKLAVSSRAALVARLRG